MGISGSGGAGSNSFIIMPGDSEADIAKKQAATAQKNKETQPAYAQSTTPDDAKLRALGIDPAQKVGPANIGKSQIIDVLGAEQLCEVTAVRVPGRVAWVNFDLARQMGFDVPRGNRMTEAFEKQVLDALSFQLLKPGEEAPEGAQSTTAYADMYGGSGIGFNKGAGRAAFLPWGNLNIKGIGITPLSVKTGNDFQHEHGGAPMKEGVLEAIWGEVNNNLFSNGSTQILAVIDTDDWTHWPEGGKEKRALIVRAGDQFRPAHMLTGASQQKKLGLEVFARATEQTGDLVLHEHKGKTVPDLAATMRNLIGKHALTAAEQYRWRILHGATSTSNMELDGGQLDLATETPQARTAPIKVLAHDDATFGTEHESRAKELTRLWSGLLTAAKSNFDKKRYNTVGIKNVAQEMNLAYAREIRVQMLKASGLKDGAARDVAAANESLATKFAETLQELGKLQNGSGAINVDKVSADGVAVADVYTILQQLPPTFFADPSGDLTDEIRKLAQPVITGGGKGAQKLQQRFDALTSQLATLYPQVMEAATQVADSHYDDDASMVRSISQRADFENRPIDQLYRSNLVWDVLQEVHGYDASHSQNVFKEAIDKRVAVSLRNVDGLIGQGRATKLGDGGIELAKRAIDGVDYGVRGWEDGKRRLHIEIPVEGNDTDGYNLFTLAGEPKLSADQIGNLSYMSTTDGWASKQYVPAELTTNDDGEKVVAFDIPTMKSDAGMLEGLFHCTGNGDFWLKDGASNFRGYTFAVPDNKELEALASKL